MRLLQSRWTRAWIVLSVLWLLPTGWLFFDPITDGIQRLSQPPAEVKTCVDLSKTSLQCSNNFVKLKDLQPWVIYQYGFKGMDDKDFLTAHTQACDLAETDCRGLVQKEHADRFYWRERTAFGLAFVFAPPIALLLLVFAVRWVWRGR